MLRIAEPALTVTLSCR